MWFFHKPAEQTIQAFLLRQRPLPFSYREVGGSHQETPKGFDIDHNRMQLGTGQGVFHAACAAVTRWHMFPRLWTDIYRADTPIQAGNVVAVLFRVLGLWWLNACRIVYVIETTEPSRCFGFAYGTLPGHVECGEERFMIEWDSQDRVWYDIRAFSRPRDWRVRLGYPVARRMQKRFVADSQAAMRHVVMPTSFPQP